MVKKTYSSNYSTFEFPLKINDIQLKKLDKLSIKRSQLNKSLLSKSLSSQTNANTGRRRQFTNFHEVIVQIVVRETFRECLTARGVSKILITPCPFDLP